MAGNNYSYYPYFQNGGYVPLNNQQNQNYNNYGTPMNQGMQMQNSSGSLMTIYVNSEEEVNNYPVAAGTTVLLMSFNLNKFWLKSTSTSGIPEPIREFSFDEIKAQTPQQQTDGVSREEFIALAESVKKLINDLGGESNG